MKLKHILLLGSIGISYSCSNNAFRSDQMSSREEVVGTQEPSLDQTPLDQTPLDQTPAQAVTSEEPEELIITPDDGVHVNLYTFGEEDQPIDYLFILDNSGSMTASVQAVNQGFLSLLQNDVFPRNSKVAVMTTLISDPNDFNVVHSDVNGDYNGIQFEPGFLDFVNKTAIVNYRNQVNDNRADNFLLDGCDDKWFSPQDTDGNGTPCLVAATQSAFAVGVEAGVTAFEQLNMKHKDNKIFRKDALLNVIFVSDTHDPGRNVQELIDNRKNFAQLDELTKTYQDIKSLKFHAMAPFTQCSSENLYDLSYFTLVDASKGEKADICVSTDYSVFLKAMVEASIDQEPVFKLSKAAEEVIGVYVDGQPIEPENYSLSDDKQSIRIEGLMPGVQYAVTLEYK